MANGALLLLSAAILADQVTPPALNHRSGHVALTNGTREQMKDVLVANFAILSFRSNGYNSILNLDS